MVEMQGVGVEVGVEVEVVEVGLEVVGIEMWVVEVE